MGVIMDTKPDLSSDSTPLIPLDVDARDPALRPRGVFILMLALLSFFLLRYTDGEIFIIK